MEQEQDIIEGNLVIADFMGCCLNLKKEATPYNYRVSKTLPDFSAGELKYHSSWDWLMPVVEKIEQNHEVKIDSVFCEINMSDGNSYCIGTIEKDADTKIEAVWLAVVEFIKWYNQNK